MDLNIGIIQTNLHWENPKANRAMFTRIIMSINTTVDLIILPEMFTTGFSMNAKGLAEDPLGETFLWMKSIALKHDCAITGSYIVKENDKYYNRLLIVDQHGIVATYDKRHLFTLAGEHNTYTAGEERVVFELNGWKICPQICYDLRFPVWSRNDLAYDFLFYVANWPNQRIMAWDILLQSRAIENMSYVAGVNRIGTDANGYEHTGHSAVYDSLGKQISTSFNEKEGIQIVTLDKTHLQTTRKKLQFLEDQDTFRVD
ncbi:nitrilase family protein [Gangjinia marincola]|uniref:Nitrilase family protein n=1 Tax=Gangjinia marincola TaxID=578463 RepID=A0ABP3XT77_9FLAO